MHRGQNHLLFDILSKGGVKHPTQHMTKSIGNNYQVWGQLGHLHWEDDTTCNYAHDPSMFDHVGLPTITN